MEAFPKVGNHNSLISRKVSTYFLTLRVFIFIPNIQEFALHLKKGLHRNLSRSQNLSSLLFNVTYKYVIISCKQVCDWEILY